TFLEHDFVIVHDRQPLPLIEHYEKKSPWIWRCHIDVSHPEMATWKYLRPRIDNYDAVVSCEEFKHKMKLAQRAIMPRSILSTPKTASKVTRKSTSAWPITKFQPICPSSSKFHGLTRGRTRKA